MTGHDMLHGEGIRMSTKYGYDIMDGIEVPQLVISVDHVLRGVHQGTVHVETGGFALQGVLRGTLNIHEGARAHIQGVQQGTVNVAPGAAVEVAGAIEGSSNVERDAMIIVERTGKLAGSLNNDGRVIIRGVFGGAYSGRGRLDLEGEGYIKEPIVCDGNSHYVW